jgi:hypothetical protein
MNTYNPDKWVVVEIKSLDKSIFKVLGSWYGGYAGGDSWRMSSSITSVAKTETGYEFYNTTGSVYYCHDKAYGMSGYTAGIYASYEKLNNDKISISILDQEDVKTIPYRQSLI